METVVLNKRSSKTKIPKEKIFIDIPQSDMIFFKLFADKMGWFINSKQNLWAEYIKNSPKNVDLSEDEIMSEVRAVRYGEI
ncbi:MAG: hypothetical protein LBN18_01905 [Dysgonamonadaceae bacterium]|jgi:hypothetical protein|nr:hypothetical protein [Dysgonamonadaceae bacterium]